MAVDLQAAFRHPAIEAKPGLDYIRRALNRLPVNPLVLRGLNLAEGKLGRDVLAHRLGVSAGVLDDWRAGLVAMPHDKFLALVDVVTGIDPGWSRIKRILVVDDNADAAVTLTQLLQVLGHDASGVSDSRKAIEAASELRPHIAILDINMPHVDGLQLARLFRAHAQLKDTCLVALTAMDGNDYREMTRQAGFDAHVRKPADGALLRAIIEQLSESE